jgi:hypothetical protein
MRDTTVLIAAPGQTKVQSEDQYWVHHCRGYRSEERDIHRTPCIANAAQKPGAAHSGCEQRQRGRRDHEEGRGEAPRLTSGAEHVEDRAKQGHGTEPDDEAGQHHQHKGAPCNVPRRTRCASADATRHHGAGTDGQTDQHRGLEKANHAGESDSGGDWSLTKEGDVEQVQQIDGEHRHQPDSAGAGHNHDVAHNIVSNEACFAGRLQNSHLYALKLRTISPWRDGE